MDNTLSLDDFYGFSGLDPVEGIKRMEHLLRHSRGLQGPLLRSILTLLTLSPEDTLRYFLGHPSVDMSSLNTDDILSWSDNNVRTLQRPQKNIDIVLDVLSRYNKIYSLDTDADIISLISSLSETPNDTGTLVLIRHCFDYRRLIRYGFIPESKYIHSGIEDDYLTGMRDGEMMFWHNKSSQSIQRVLGWKHHTLESAKRVGITMGDSLPLILLSDYPGQYTYNKSKRPRNDMSMFKTAINHRISKEDIAKDVDSDFSSITLSGVTWKLIPVTRYAAGMKRGLFYNGTTDEESEADVYCGTFYYLEEESDTYLMVREKNTHQSFNKTTAMREIAPDKITYTKNSHIVDAHIYGHISVHPVLVLGAPMDGSQKTRLPVHCLQCPDGPLGSALPNGLPQDLILTPQEVGKVLGLDTSGLDQTPHYAGVKMTLYAEEDRFDQPLCIACKERGIDVLILTHMVGSRQVVKEVLDTRSRSESFNSLCYTIAVPR
jgi:hypothetical protein